MKSPYRSLIVRRSILPRAKYMFVYNWEHSEGDIVQELSQDPFKMEYLEVKESKDYEGCIGVWKIKWKQLT